MAPAATSSAPTEEAPAPSIVVSPALGSVDAAPAGPLTLASSGGVLDSVTVTGPQGTVSGTLSGDRRTWTADTALAYGSRYKVDALAAGPAGTRTRASGDVATLTPRTLTYASAIPNPDLSDVGVGQPIALYFDENVTDRAAAERALTVTSSPATLGAWHWLSGREVHYRPRDFWPAGAHVVLDADIYGVDVGNGVYGQESRHIEFDVHGK